jgi:hypothetical protein
LIYQEKTAARLDKNLKATKARIKKLKDDLKTAVTKEKAAAAKKKPARKAPAKEITGKEEGSQEKK